MLNPIEEKKYQELKDRCRELRVPPPPDIMIGLQVHDENGILVFDDVQRAHSWTRNFWNQCMYAMTGGPLSGSTYAAGSSAIKYTYGGIAATAVWPGTPSCIGTLGSTINGIVVGTDDTAFALTQFALGALIAHGTGAGQFSYAAQGAWSSAYTAGTKTWKSTTSRIMNNNSGGSITVKETGLYHSPSNTVMIERSVLAPTVTVATGGQLTVTYEISMDFSAID